MRPMRLAGTAAVLAAALRGQFAVPQPKAALVIGSFHTNLSYEATLEKLDAYYQEQVGRKRSVVLPLIAPQTHFEVWHDIWVIFMQEAGGMTVTLKRQTEGAAIVIAKGWMTQLAGRSGGELPLRFEEKPAMQSVTSEIGGSRRDMTRALEAEPGIRQIDSWQVTGLLVGADPLTRIELARAAVRGTHRLTVVADTAARARQLAGRVSAAMRGPCICAAYSETAEIDEELRKEALDKSEDVNATTAQRIYLAHMEPKQIEEKLRAQPETQKRLTAAAGWVSVRYRVDQPYAKVQLRWSELTGYRRGDGKFVSEQVVGTSSAANVRPAVPAGAQLTGRTKLTTPLKPGAYRIALEGVTAAGKTAPIDSRDYWFDGKTFEEL